jgi:Na+-driven multidrug efflux pump
MLRLAGTVWLVRIPLGYSFVAILGFGAPAVWWAMNLSQLVQALILTQRFLGKKWLGNPKSKITGEKTSV